MQTFLPYPSFSQSAQVLDRQRLGKQRAEALQIIYSLTKENYGWKNHPAVKMWENHVPALANYGIVVCDEWIGRGYKDNTREKFLPYVSGKSSNMPKWFGDEHFHKATYSARNLIGSNNSIGMFQTTFLTSGLWHDFCSHPSWK